METNLQDNILEVKDLKTQFITKEKTTTALNNISFDIKKGEILGLVGESGCGKSVTALSIMQLFKGTSGKITQGEINFKNKNISSLSSRQMAQVRGKEISMIFQEPMSCLNPTMKIGKQIVEIILQHNKTSKAEAQHLALDILKRVGIPRAEFIMNEYPHQLSGGMCQRVAIAIGIVLNPSLLIADEPTTALDVTIQAQILELMQQINQEFNTSILLITHDLGVVASLCQRVIVMYAGRIVEEAPVDELFASPKHPYTQGLLASTPIMGKRVERLFTIEGNVPTLDNMPSGCAFAPRCKHAMPVCTGDKLPPEVSLENGVSCKCWLYEPHLMEVSNAGNK